MGDSALEKIKRYQKDFFSLEGISSLLVWDLETYMTKKGSETRAEQITLINSIYHKKLISNELFEALEELKTKNLLGDERVLVNKLYKKVWKARKLPLEFIEEMSRVTSLAFSAWQKSRDKNDFKIFEPFLKKIVELKRREADYLKLGEHPYDSLLDDFEEGMTVSKLKPKFAELKRGILNLLKDIKKTKIYKNQKLVFLKKQFPKESQITLAKEIMERIGLKNESSRIDFSEHPFTMRIGAEDVRITTNIRDFPLFSFLSTAHEAGHGLYESNLPEKYLYTILYDAPSKGIHESQSRFWEIMVGHGKPFWKYYFEEFKRKFGIDDFDKWYKEINFVSPNKIRIESDEVHYPLHIILRFEIEVGLIEGTISVEDLPKIWNEKMKEFLDVVPESDKEGVLQDVHWSQGLFGYFPTYAFGSIYAAQLYDKLKTEIPDIEEDIAKGEFSRAGNWLKEHVHKYGGRFLADEIIIKTCGEGLNPEKYLDYLRQKYSDLYGF